MVVDPRKIEDMASEIVNLLLNSEMRREIGLYGRKYVIRHCSWESVARKIVLKYRVCSDRKGMKWLTINIGSNLFSY